MNLPDLFKCDQCGGYFAEIEFAETIEEMLCEQCASGIDDDREDDFHDGFEEGFECED